MMEPRRNISPAPAPLDIVSTSTDATASPTLRLDSVLACMRFGLSAKPAGGARLAPVNLEVVAEDGGSGVHCLSWLSRLPVMSGEFEGIHYADNGELLFGWVHVPETGLDDMAGAARETHLRLHRLLQVREKPHWLRAWNYLSRINEGEGDAERYRQFAAGRHLALSEVFADEPRFERFLPAATAIGTQGDTGMILCFLAGRTPGIQVENPRQVSAFDYPRRYGSRSPSFSRATLHHWADRDVLFVSGTASIVGHATLHPGDVAAQFEETLCNLETLVAHAAREHYPAGLSDRFVARAFKLYVRNREQLTLLGARWRQALAARAPTAVLIGDLCRRDLLVEVEAIYERSHS